MRKIPLMLFLSSLVFLMPGCRLVSIANQQSQNDEIEINRLAVTTPPFKNSYLVGEMFSSIGLVVVDQNNVELYNFKLSLEENHVFTIDDIGDYRIDVTLENYESTYFSVEVHEEHKTGPNLVSLYITNDMHGQVDSQSNRCDLVTYASFLKERSDEENTLLIDQGDTWQGSIYSNNNHGELLTDVMNYVKFDARTVGNHDFDWGVEYVKHNTAMSYEGYSTPVLAANVYDYNFLTKVTGSTQQSDIGRKTVSYVLENGLKVGIVGVIGYKQITSIVTRNVQNIIFKNHINVIKEEATKLRDEENCDIVIASCHAGQEDMLGYNLEDYVDLVLCAHTHRYENTYENGLYYAQYGGYNQYIGHIDLSYDPNTKEVTYETIEALDKNYISEHTTKDTTIKSLVDAKLNEYHDEAYTIVANSVTGSFYSSDQMANLMCKAIYDEAVKEGYSISLSYCNNARASLYGSIWYYEDIFQAFPFENEIYIIEIDGHDMMNEVSEYNYVCRSPSFDGTVSYSGTYRIAVIDYLAIHTNTSRNYDYFPSARVVDTLNYNYREILYRWLIDNNYHSGAGLYASDFSSSLEQFNRHFVVA